MFLFDITSQEVVAHDSVRQRLLYMGNGKENGNYYSIVGCVYIYIFIYLFMGVILWFYRDNGKENGNYSSACPLLHRQPEA